MGWKGVIDIIEVGAFWSLSRNAVTSFGPWRTTYTAPKHTATAATDLFFILQRRSPE
jgi:hypothetical protein